jgi:hypothetical protein
MAERVCLLHWSEPEGAERARVAAFGYTVDHESRVRQGARGADLVLWFVRSARQLKRGLQRYAALDVPVWIIWPKQASGVDTDLTQNAVRAAGLGVGLVDYKVCAVDETWSGLLFRRRR